MQNYTDLYHYGIPGMRWGIRRNPRYKYIREHDRQLTKASKYDSKIRHTTNKKKIEKYTKKRDEALTRVKNAAAKANEYLKKNRNLSIKVDRAIDNYAKQPKITNVIEALRKRRILL